MKAEARSAFGDGSDLPWQRSKAMLRARYRACLLAIDASCIFFSLLLASQIYLGSGSHHQWLIVGSALFPVYLAAALNAHAYSTELLAERGGAARAIQAILLSIGVLTFIAFYLKIGAEFSRGTFAIGSVIATVSLGFARLQFFRHVRRADGPSPFNLTLIQDSAELPVPPGKFTARIAADSWLDPDSDDPDMFDQLAMLLKEADRVVVVCKPERRLSWAKALKGANIRGEIIAPELDMLAPLGVASWGEASTLVVADGPLSSMDAMLKRGFDITVSALALLVLAPVMIVVAIAIKLDSAGPVFFSQVRIGQANRKFRVLKFRSMRTDLCDSAGNTSTGRDDDRITRIGQLIRKTSIDELPQLLNVLRGDMSIVGPRPHALGSKAADKLFWEVDDRYWHRHAAKPGLTGLAQVRGFRGATVEERDLTNRLQADLEYLHDWSLWKDMLIIMQTFRVLIHRNAY